MYTPLNSTDILWPANAQDERPGILPLCYSCMEYHNLRVCLSWSSKEDLKRNIYLFYWCISKMKAHYLNFLMHCLGKLFFTFTLMVTDSVRIYNFSLSPWWWQIQKHSVRFYNLKFGQRVSFPLHRKEATEKPLKAMQLEDRTKMSWIPWVWSSHVEKSQWKACTRTDWKFNFCPWQFLWFCPVGSIGTTTMAAHGSTPLDKLSTGKLFFMSSKWEILHIDTTHESTAKAF